MIDIYNPASMLHALSPDMLKAQGERLQQAAFDEGYAARRNGQGRTAPPYRDARMTEWWHEGYDHAAELYKPRTVDQSSPEDAIKC